MTDHHQMDDEWLTGDDEDGTTRGYAVDKFYITATDGHGHGGKIQVKMKESELALIGQWVGEATTIYRSPQDFIRDAVHHRLHQLHELKRGGKLSKGLREALVSAGLQAEKVLRDQRHDAMKMLDEEVDELVKTGQFDDAQDAIDSMWEAVDEDWPPRMREIGKKQLHTWTAKVQAARGVK